MTKEIERSRAEEIIYEIECGGFAECELDDIEAAIVAAREELEQDNDYGPELHGDS